MGWISQGWGEGPDAEYETVAQRFRGQFATIRTGAIQRELERTLPEPEIRALAAAGFTALRVPRSHGGAGINLPTLFALLTELGEADSNVAQALRAHFGFVEVVLNSPHDAWRDTWLRRIVAGELVGPGRGESGSVQQGTQSTQLRQHEGQWRLSGTKFYSTGLQYADWADVGASGTDGTLFSVLVRRDAPGVEVVDDWNGFGQRLTASGTTHYRDTPVDPGEIRPAEHKFPYSQAFFQLVHLATIAGIGRALSQETAQAVHERTRNFSNGSAALVRDDPQVLEVVGQLRAAAYSAGAIVQHTARALERAWQASQQGDAEATGQARAIADLEVAQSQALVIDLILQASSQLFDALGASSTLRPQGLDRFWRNVRTIATHNPRIFKTRIAGDFAVNGTPAPDQWQIGVA